MSRNLKVSGALIAFVLVVVTSAFLWSVSQDKSTADAAPIADESATNAQVVREESHVLGEPGSTEVTLVEFLDFECEACGAFYPYVEQLREAYEGRVTFVARYFPLPSHRNSMNAALAVEASAQQGRFEDMYSKMFQTQSTWGDQKVDHAGKFRGFAEELGLDMAQYDDAVAAPATKERVEADVKDGTALGVQGTPGFFLNGEQYQPESMEAFRQAIDEALTSAS